MKTIDFALDSEKNGGKITAFNYSHSLNDLVGSWFANVVNGSFRAGDAISFNGVMTNGIITRAYKDYEGLWHIEGKDAGIYLMKSIPDISDLPNGDAKTVISYIANFCNISLQMSVNGLSGFNVRSIISGTTCAEAILELALVSGLIAYIDKNGVLVVIAPSNSSPHFNNVIDDSGSDIDLDGYATQVLVVLNRKKYVKEDNVSQHEPVYYGSTPDSHPQEVTYQGSFSEGVNGSYSITKYEPFDVVKKIDTTITDDKGIITHTVEEHDYDYKTKNIWRDNQEYVLFAFIERGYTLTKTTQGSYQGVIERKTSSGVREITINPTFKEETTETMTRRLGSTYSAPAGENNDEAETSNNDNPLGIPTDWLGNIQVISSEEIQRSTVRTGSRTPSGNMPDYAPPFDSKIKRKFSRKDDGRKLFCEETEENYEARQVGSIAPVKYNGEFVPHFMQNSDLAIQTHSTPQWVLVKTKRSYYEEFDDDGSCLFSARSEYSDDGAEWLVEHALSDTGDDSMNDYEAAYAALSQHSSNLSVSLGSSAFPTAWHFIELRGRTRSTVEISELDRALGDIYDWYENGLYIRNSVCPHYNNNTKSCNVYLFDALHNIDNPKTSCSRHNGKLQWLSCTRALDALDRARVIEAAQIEPSIIGSASVPNKHSVGYKREFYLDDNINDVTAQHIANTIAQNILIVKGLKGFRKTVTIPYNTDFQTDGAIVEVSHDWQNLTTSVTYRDKGEITECLISQSVASIADFVSTRHNARLCFPQYGVVQNVSNDNFSVKVGNSLFSCTSKLKNLAQNDIVLVVFPAGNKLRGQIISRL